MKQRIIYFDEQEYLRQLPIIQELVNKINEYNSNNPICKLSADDVREINKNSSNFKNTIYLNKLE